MQTYRNCRMTAAPYEMYCVAAGKSAGMILRQINPEALAEAHALHYDDTCHMLQRCSLTAEQMPEATDAHSHFAPAQISR